MITARAIAPRMIGTLRTRALTVYSTDVASEAHHVAASLGAHITYVSKDGTMTEWSAPDHAAFVTLYARACTTCGQAIGHGDMHNVMCPNPQIGV